jgi:hypothetical protein
MKKEIFILFCLGGLIFVSGCGETPVTITNGKTFTIEYDHQQSWTCFPWWDGPERARKAFKKADTELNIIYNDTTLTDSLVKLSQRLIYHDDHRQWEDSIPVFPAYLCGIKAFTYDNGVMIDTIAGWTYYSIYFPRWSFVCGYIAYGYNFRDKTSIHELGHQRANLSHLCIDENTMNPDHNAEDCVMGQGEWAVCTNKNLTNHPEFCSNCCNIIRGISW